MTLWSKRVLRGDRERGVGVGGGPQKGRSGPGPGPGRLQGGPAPGEIWPQGRGSGKTPPTAGSALGAGPPGEPLTTQSYQTPQGSVSVEIKPSLLMGPDRAPLRRPFPHHVDSPLARARAGGAEAGAGVPGGRAAGGRGAPVADLLTPARARILPLVRGGEGPGESARRVARGSVHARVHCRGAGRGQGIGARRHETWVRTL